MQVLALRWRRAVALLALMMLTGCSPPPELEGRAPSPADVGASSLLPSGTIQPLADTGARDAAEVRTISGARMVALRFASEAEAAAAFAVYAEAKAGMQSRTRVDFGAMRYLRYTTERETGLIWQSDRWIFEAEASSPASLAAVIAQSRAGGVGEGNASIVALVIALAALVLAIVCAAVIAMVLRRLAVRPAPGTATLGGAVLQARLLALNGADRPWLVRIGPEADLIVEWKYAYAEWWGLMAKSGLAKAYRLRLYFDESRYRCDALDEFGEIEWNAGVLGAPRLHFGRSFFRGVQLVRRERGVAYGLGTPTGAPGKVLDYRFDIDEVKRPIIDVVVAAGWTFRPVLWPKRR